MSEGKNGVSTKQLTIILVIVSILLGAPLTITSFWSISNFERIEDKIELMDSKMNRLTVDFVEVRGALKAKGIVVHQSERRDLEDLESESDEPVYGFSPDSSAVLSSFYFVDPCGWVDSHGSEGAWSFVEEEDTLFESSLGFPVYSVFKK